MKIGFTVIHCDFLPLPQGPVGVKAYVFECNRPCLYYSFVSTMYPPGITFVVILGSVKHIETLRTSCVLN